MKKRATIGSLLAAVGALALIRGGLWRRSKERAAAARGGASATALPASSCCRYIRRFGVRPPLSPPTCRLGRLAHADAADGGRDQVPARPGEAGQGRQVQLLNFQAATTPRPSSGKWDAEQASANAHAYARNSKLLGVVGTFCGLRRDRDPRVERVGRGLTLLCRPTRTNSPDRAARGRPAGEETTRAVPPRARRAERPEPGCRRREVPGQPGRQARIGS